MRCAYNRWGPGTTCEKPTNKAGVKDLQDRLAAMRNERTSQDKMWESEPEKKDIVITTTNKQSPHNSTHTGGR
jgi:hypothetical protein